MGNRVLPLLLVFLAGTALVLNSQGKLIPVGQAIFSAGYDLPTVDRIGSFALAFFVYLLVISFLDDKETEYLTGILVLGALVYNAETKGADAVIPTLFGGSPARSQNSTFAPFHPDPSQIIPNFSTSH